MTVLLGEVQKPRPSVHRPRLDAASSLLLCRKSSTHQSGLLTLACAVLNLGRCGIGCFALAVAVHDFGDSVVA